MTEARTSLFLMANLGAEVSRIASLKKRGQADAAEKAKDRALSIVSSIRSMPDMHSRLREIDLLNDVIESIASTNPTLDIASEHLDSYFQPFAIRLLASR